MSEDNEPKGALRARLNADKQPGDKKPAFHGTLTLPGETGERELALWAEKTRKGATMLAGKAAESAIEKIKALAGPPKVPDTAPRTDGKQFAIDPYDVMLFENIKDGKTPNPPDYWGYYHPGSDKPLMRLAVWARTDRDGKVLLSGTVRAHQSEATREMDPSAPTAPVRPRRRERER